MIFKHKRVFPVEIRGYKLLERYHSSDAEPTVWAKQKVIIFSTRQFETILLQLRTPKNLRDLERFIIRLVKDHNSESSVS